MPPDTFAGDLGGDAPAQFRGNRPASLAITHKSLNRFRWVAENS
jgi:hypothetical protein